MTNNLRRLATALALSLFLASCGLSDTEIAETVKLSMQQTFDTQEQFKEWNLRVMSVQVVKKSGNQYQGMAAIIHEGSTHEVPVEVTADETKVMWKAEPGAFAFVLQKELQKLQNGWPE